MPSLSTQPPADGWRYVLQHPRLLAHPGHTHPLAFSSYSETLASVGVQLPGEPMRHHLFARDRATRDRACAEGWRDVTDAFRAAQLAAAPKLSTPAQVAVHAVLQDQPMDKAQIVEASGITHTHSGAPHTHAAGGHTTHTPAARWDRASARLRPNRAYRYTRGPAWADAVDVVDTEVAGGSFHHHRQGGARAGHPQHRDAARRLPGRSGGSGGRAAGLHRAGGAHPHQPHRQLRRAPGRADRRGPAWVSRAQRVQREQRRADARHQRLLRGPTHLGCCGWWQLAQPGSRGSRPWR